MNTAPKRFEGPDKFDGSESTEINELNSLDQNKSQEELGIIDKIKYELELQQVPGFPQLLKKIGILVGGGSLDAYTLHLNETIQFAYSTLVQSGTIDPTKTSYMEVQKDLWEVIIESEIVQYGTNKYMTTPVIEHFRGFEDTRQKLHDVAQKERFRYLSDGTNDASQIIASGLSSKIDPLKAVAERKKSLVRATQEGYFDAMEATLDQEFPLEDGTIFSFSHTPDYQEQHKNIIQQREDIIVGAKKFIKGPILSESQDEIYLRMTSQPLSDSGIVMPNGARINTVHEAMQYLSVQYVQDSQLYEFAELGSETALKIYEMRAKQAKKSGLIEPKEILPYGARPLMDSDGVRDESVQSLITLLDSDPSTK